MSEERVITEEESLIDFALGGEDDSRHSPEAEKETDSETGSNAPEAEDVAETFDPYGDDDSEDSFADDSAEEESKAVESKEGKAPADADSAEETEAKTPAPAQVDHSQEIANLQKRLHDTQQAMHKATARAADLQKKLDALESKKSTKNSGDSEEDWFSDSDDDDKEVTALKQELEEIKKENEDLGNQQQDIQQQANLAAWHNAAAPLRAEHADFDELVYEKLEPLLDPETGDARIRELYLQQKDRTPSGAYKFAKSLPMIFEILENPEAFHAKMHSLDEKIKQAPPENKTASKANKKAALDMVNSADFADAPRGQSRSLVDDIFG
jgi:chromosome segregation ATPase